MIFTKYIDRKLYYYIDPFVGTLSLVELVMRVSYHCTVVFIPGMYVFGRDVSLNLTTIVGWNVGTASKQRQVNIILSAKIQVSQS